VTNSCDVGVFDERGVEVGGPGFRGWSGGFRTSFFVPAEDATPGSLPGPVNAGRWCVILGPYQVCPQGLDYSVSVTLSYGSEGTPVRPSYPPQSVPGTGRRWYRGDSHLHTVYSDGRRTPDQVAAGARAAGLDFIVSTDHNTSSSHGAWGPLAGDDLLVVTGEEVTTRNGHVLAIGVRPGHWVDWRYRAGDGIFGGVADAVRKDGGIIVPAHPHCAYVGCRWKFGYDDADAVEVWNGPWTLDDETAVETWDALLVASSRTADGWLPAMGNSDAHSEPQVIGLPQTAVHAESLSRDAVLAGIAAGRSYLVESKSVDVSLTPGGPGVRPASGSGCATTTRRSSWPPTAWRCAAGCEWVSRSGRCRVHRRLGPGHAKQIRGGAWARGTRFPGSISPDDTSRHDGVTAATVGTHPVGSAAQPDRVGHRRHRAQGRGRRDRVPLPALPSASGCRTSSRT
jgi:hypothetical protein